MDMLRFSAFLRKNTRLEIDRDRCRMNMNRQRNNRLKMVSEAKRYLFVMHSSF